jgi:hypothetical protein
MRLGFIFAACFALVGCSGAAGPSLSGVLMGVPARAPALNEGRIS